MNPSGPVEQIELVRASNAEIIEKEAAMDKKAFVTVDEDSVNSGIDEPTEADLNTLKRVSGKIPWTAYTIAFVEFCERFSYYGTTVVCKSSFFYVIAVPLSIFDVLIVRYQLSTSFSNRSHQEVKQVLLETDSRELSG